MVHYAFKVTQSPSLLVRFGACVKLSCQNNWKSVVLKTPLGLAALWVSVAARSSNNDNAMSD